MAQQIRQITFVNQTNGAWAWKDGHTLVIEVTEGLKTVKSPEVALNASWVYQATSNKITFKVKSKYVHGWPVLKKEQNPQLAKGTTFYVRESDHQTAFELSRKDSGSVPIFD